MIYLLLSGVSAYLGITVGLGASTLLRPLLDAVTSLPPASVAMLCTMATLVAALVSAFFALSKPLPLDQDELLFLAAGGLLGGVVGDLISARFITTLSPGGVVLLQNALLFALIALPAIYFGTLSRTIRPLDVTRMASLPLAFVIGLFASFLSFGAEPVTIAAYYLLFDAQDDEAAIAALTIALTSMAGKLVTLLIRQRLFLPDADTLLWLLPGALVGAVCALLLSIRTRRLTLSDLLIKMSLFTSLINMAASLAR